MEFYNKESDISLFLILLYANHIERQIQSQWPVE